MDILLIGGSRFVGPLVIGELLKRGHKVTVFNRGHIAQSYPEKVHFIKGDRENSFGALKNRFNAVIDMCAYNGEHTRRALAEIHFDFFVHFSTVAVYKKTETFPLTEESPLGNWPVWGRYNKGKVECEEELKKSGVKYASLRPVYILGPKNYIDRERFIYGKLKQGDPIIIPGNGQAPVQCVSSFDVARVLTFLAEEQIEGAFNSAADEVITLKHLVKEMANTAGQVPIIRYNPETDGEKFNPLEFPFANEPMAVSNEKLKSRGISFKPLLQLLKEDYEEYYKFLAGNYEKYRHSIV